MTRKAGNAFHKALCACQGRSRLCCIHMDGGPVPAETVSNFKRCCLTTVFRWVPRSRHSLSNMQQVLLPSLHKMITSFLVCCICISRLPSSKHIEQPEMDAQRKLSVTSNGSWTSQNSDRPSSPELNCAEYQYRVDPRDRLFAQIAASNPYADEVERPSSSARPDFAQDEYPRTSDAPSPIRVAPLSPLDLLIRELLPPISPGKADQSSPPHSAPAGPLRRPAFSNRAIHPQIPYSTPAVLQHFPAQQSRAQTLSAPSSPSAEWFSLGAVPSSSHVDQGEQHRISGWHTGLATMWMASVDEYHSRNPTSTQDKTSLPIDWVPTNGLRRRGAISRPNPREPKARILPRPPRD